VKRAQDWRWGSLHARLHGPPEVRELLADWPIDVPDDWTAHVNRPQTAAEEAAIQLCARRGRPLGDDGWVRTMVGRYDLQSTLRERGRQAGWRRTRE
jgi:putative transposase